MLASGDDNSHFHQNTIASSVLLDHQDMNRSQASPKNIVAQIYNYSDYQKDFNNKEKRNEVLSTCGPDPVDDLFNECATDSPSPSQGLENDTSLTETQRKHLKAAKLLYKYEALPKEGFLQDYPVIDNNAPQERLEYLALANQESMPDNHLSLSRGSKISLENLVKLYKLVRERRQKVTEIYKQDDQEDSASLKQVKKKQKLSLQGWKGFFTHRFAIKKQK